MDMERKKKMNKIWYCPTDDWTCPYNKDGECKIDSPMEDCDCFYGYEDEEEDEIYIIHLVK